MKTDKVILSAVAVAAVLYWLKKCNDAKMAAAAAANTPAPTGSLGINPITAQTPMPAASNN